MQAIVKKHNKARLILEERPIPEPADNEIRIKILKTSICGTDVHIWNWDEWAQKNVPLGTITGHEYCGVIDKIGTSVRGFKEGELLSGEGHLTCGICRNCLTGRQHLCEDTHGVGIQRDGAFAEYLCIPAINVWTVEPDFNQELLAIFDPFGNATHTALTLDLLGEDVLVTGAGPIGIMAVAIARFAGARSIVITDVNDYRLELALKMGADQAVNINQDNLENVKKNLHIREGFDVGLEMSGSPQAFGQIIQHVRHGATISLLGILPNHTQVEWDRIVFKGLTLKGIYGRKMYDTWYKMTHMLQGGLDISPIITHRFHYSDFEQAFELMKSGRSGKIILNWAEI